MFKLSDCDIVSFKNLPNHIAIRWDMGAAALSEAFRIVKWAAPPQSALNTNFRQRASFGACVSILDSRAIYSPESGCENANCFAHSI